jgi:hypothetical protein
VIEEHHRSRLAFIGGPKNNWESEERYQAFLDSLKEHQIPYYPELTYEGDFLYESGYASVKYLLENNLEFDAIICANDNMAVGALTQLYKQLGKIPEQLSITGFDDTFTSKFHSLTTVKQPFYELARAAADTLHKLIKGEETQRTVEFPAEIILRSSCGCISNALKNTEITLNLSKNEPLTDLCEATKSTILTELNEFNKYLNKEDYELLLGLENEIIDALYSELFDNRPMEFINYWNKFVFWTITKREDISFLQDILICIRKNVLTNLITVNNLIKAESMFHAANIISCDAVQRTGASLS